MQLKRPQSAQLEILTNRKESKIGQDGTFIPRVRSPSEIQKHTSAREMDGQLRQRDKIWSGICTLNTKSYRHSGNRNINKKPTQTTKTTQSSHGTERQNNILLGNVHLLVLYVTPKRRLANHQMWQVLVIGFGAHWLIGSCAYWLIGLPWISQCMLPFVYN